MSVQRCDACGGLFAHLPRGVCATCLDQRESEFRAVRDWLRGNRGSGIAEASEATGVDEGTIVRFIREGRIDVVDPAADPVLARDRELDARREELVRQLSEAPRLGSSVPADGRPDAPLPQRSSTGHSRGMRTRRS